MQCHKLFCQGIKKANYPPPVIIMSWMSRDIDTGLLLVVADQNRSPIGGDSECRLHVATEWPTSRFPAPAMRPVCLYVKVSYVMCDPPYIGKQRYSLNFVIYNLAFKEFLMEFKDHGRQNIQLTGKNGS